MSNSHTLTASRDGAVLLSLNTGIVDIDAMIDPSATKARIVLILSGPLPEGAEDSFSLQEEGHKLSFTLSSQFQSGGSYGSVTSFGNGSVIQVGHNSGMVAGVVHGDVVMGRVFRGDKVQFGNGNVQYNSFGGTSSYTSGDGYSKVIVGDKVIEVINGETWINGHKVDEGAPAGDNETASDRPARPVPMPQVLTVRAILPPRSGLNAATTTGDVSSRGIAAVGIKTNTGDIDASGLTRDSWLRSNTGDLDVTAGEITDKPPVVKAVTNTGDITCTGNIRLQPQTNTGDVYYQ